MTEPSRARSARSSDPEHVLRVAVGRGLWHHELAAALQSRVDSGSALDYSIIDLDSSDWQKYVEPFDLVLWRGRFIGPQSAGHYKDKIYFMERVLEKTVMPGHNTVWSYDSKVAQSYLFTRYEIPTPRTFVSFDYDEADRVLDEAPYPIVAKRSYGASSTNVRLIKGPRAAHLWLDRLFFHEKYMRHKAHYPNLVMRAVTAPLHAWFWPKLTERLTSSERHAVAYWQEFIPGNDADLRVTVIGDSHAFGFWRRNRRNDFRASGSGLIDYATPVPEAALRYCISLNRRFAFDSMAYDLLFHEGRFLIVEISYGYIDTALADAPGHFFLDSNDSLRYLEGSVMPQELWVDWALRKASRQT